MNETSKINFETYGARDYYRLLLVKKHKSAHTGPERWERDISIDTENWTASKISKENKLKEFHFKFIYRIVNTKKELCRYGISTDNDCIYFGEPDSTNHTFIDCEFIVKPSYAKSLSGLTLSLQPDTKELLIATFEHPTYMELVRKFNDSLILRK